MDMIDKRILHILARDADTPSTALSKELNLSVPAINKRIARLKADGVIRRTTVLTDPEEVGKPIVVYVLITMEAFSKSDDLLRYCNTHEDVLECYAVTGEYDYVLKMCAADIHAVEEVLLHFKQHLGVSKSNTMLALMEHRFAPAVLPTPEE